MLATLDLRPFTRQGWLFERKLDGERCLAFRCGDSVRLRSRADTPLEDTYPELVDAIRAQPVDDFVVDGEVVAFAGAATSFSRLQQRMHVRDQKTARLSGIKVHYYLFDLLYLLGHDISGLALTERKALLRRAIDFGGPLRYTPHRVAAGEEAFARACARGWEGIIAKRADSVYVQARSRDWLKWKCLRVGEFVVGGYTTAPGSRAGFGSLLVGVPVAADGDQTPPLVFAGRVGTGFDEATMALLFGVLSSMEVEVSPFTPDSLRGEGRSHRYRSSRASGVVVHWVRPRLVVRVGFVEWTAEGRLRHPRYLGLPSGHGG